MPYRTFTFHINFVSMIAILHFAITKPLFGQSDDIRFDHISVEHGLSQDIVTSIIQDKHGFMWFGTEDGLNRYDGYTIKTFKHDPRDSTSILSNVIGPIYEDRNGVLWIAIVGGLEQYDADRNIFVHHRHDETDPRSLSHSHVTSICEDGDGNLWIGTSYGLNRLAPDRKQFVRYHHHSQDQNSISSDHISALYKDRSNTLWVGTDNGLNMYDAKNARFIRYFCNEKPSFTISGLADDGNGNLWIGFFGYGVKRFSPITGRITHYRPQRHNPTSLGDVLVGNICIDNKGAVWIALFSSLDKYDPVSNSFIHYRHNPNNPFSLSSNRIYALFKDRAGVLWMGTWHGGVSRYDPSKQKFALFRNIPNNPKSLSDNEVLAILEDRSGDTWVGTASGGLNRYNHTTKQFTCYRHEPGNPHSISSNTVTALCEDRHGNLWVGCDNGTLDRLDRKRNIFEHYPLKNIKTIFEDSEGELWLGLMREQEAVIRLNPISNAAAGYRNFPSHPDSLHGAEVWCMYEDKSGDLWLGTWDDRGGHIILNRFHRKENRFSHYGNDPGDPHSISSNAVRAIHQDRQGFTWFGTWGAGMNKYDPTTGKFTRFYEGDGLPNNYIKGILADDRGNLWISTEMGLSKFNPSTGVFKNFTIDDGLQGERFLSGSCFKGRSGKFYFGGEGGYNVFYPDSIRDNPNIPAVVITGFKVFDKPVQLLQSISVTKEILLKYEEDAFSFEFVALDYTTPRRNQYAYMMEGFDEDWIYAGTRRYASYTHLDPGIYTFRVKGSNNDGVWNEQGASVSVIIQPAYWQTWWFRGAVFLVLAALLYGLYRYRINKLLELERTRNRIARDLHDEIGATLGSISHFASAIRTETEPKGLPLSRKYLSLITESAEKAQEAMDDIVWSINPAHDSWDDILPRLQRYASDLFESKGIRYAIDMPNGVNAPPLAMEKRRNFWLVFKEMVTNAAKHSGCTEAAIAFSVNGSTIELRVEDNGKGFDTTAATTRNGLNNIRARAASLGGQLDLDTVPGRGTRWMLRFEA